MAFPGIDGFLGTRASIMLDTVFLAMFLVVPALACSIWIVKRKRNFALHKRIQVTLGLVLLGAIMLFEVDMRFVSGWRERAEPSPYFGTDESAGWVWKMLYIHLCFAISTTILWIVVVVRALRNFPKPPKPAPHSRWHKLWAWITAVDTLLTAVTGNWFYYLAFIAE